MRLASPFTRVRFSIRDIFWLTLMVALIAGWFIDHRRLSPPTPAPPMLAAVPASPPINRNPYNEIVRGYNAAGLPVFTGPRGGFYHYSETGGKFYEKRGFKITSPSFTLTE